MKTKYASARGKKISEALRAKYTPEELSARSQRRWAGISPEQKRASAKKANEARWATKEQHRHMSKKASEVRMTKLTRKQRSAISRKAGLASMAKLTPEQRREKSKKGGMARIAGLSPEEIKTMSRKANEARMAKYTPEEWRAMGVKAGNASWASKTQAQRDAFAKRSSERMKKLMAAGGVKAIENGAAVPAKSSSSGRKLLVARLKATMKGFRHKQFEDFADVTRDQWKKWRQDGAAYKDDSEVDLIIRDAIRRWLVR